MESTGVYLENLQYLKKVPDKKSDVKDCEWIATLLRCGLISSSFISGISKTLAAAIIAGDRGTLWPRLLLRLGAFSSSIDSSSPVAAAFARIICTGNFKKL